MKISVIVPIYQTKQYLPRCIDSLLSQTFDDFELILVDDGSTDGSGLICDEYAEKDARVSVIHQANAGVSSARNKGIEAAKGEYIAFVDSDDYLLPQYVEHLAEGAAKNPDADAVVTGLIEIQKDRRIEWSCDPCVYSLAEFKKNFTHLVSASEPVAKIYKRATIGELRFDESMTMGEDALFNLRFFARCGKLVYVPYMEYVYDRRNEGSASKNFKQSYIPCYRKLYVERKLFLYGEVKCDFDWADENFCRNGIGLIQGICYQKTPPRQKKEQIAEVLGDELFQAVLLGDYAFPLKMRIPQRLCRQKKRGLLLIFFGIKKRLRFLAASK